MFPARSINMFTRTMGFLGDMHIPQETHHANEPLSLRRWGELQAEQLWSLVSAPMHTCPKQDLVLVANLRLLV